MIFIVSIYSLVYNFGQDKAGEWVDSESYIVKSSIGSSGTQKESYTGTYITVLVILHTFLICLLLIGSYALKSNQAKISIEVKKKTIMPSNYCLFVTGIPKHKTETDVKEWFKGIFPDLEIVYVNFCYDIKEIIESVRKRTLLKQKLAKMDSYNKMQLELIGKNVNDQRREHIPYFFRKRTLMQWCCCEKSKTKRDFLEDKILSSTSEIKELQKRLDAHLDPELFSGSCFIVMNDARTTEAIIDKFQISMWRHLLDYFIYDIFRCKNIEIDYRYWEGRRIIVERAAEPGDIYWENLSIGLFKRNFLKFICNITVIILLLTGFAINFGLNKLRVSFEEQNISSSKNYIKIRVIAACTSLIIVVINILLTKVIRISSAYEKHETYSKYNISVAFKLWISTFVNTGIIPLLINKSKEDWFKVGGLMTIIFNNMLCISIVTPILYVLNPGYFLLK